MLGLKLSLVSRILSFFGNHTKNISSRVHVHRESGKPGNEGRFPEHRTQAFHKTRWNGWVRSQANIHRLIASCTLAEVHVVSTRSVSSGCNPAQRKEMHTNDRGDFLNCSQVVRGPLSHICDIWPNWLFERITKYNSCSFSRLILRKTHHSIYLFSNLEAILCFVGHI